MLHVMVNIGNTRTTVAMGDGARIWGIRHFPTHSWNVSTMRAALRAVTGSRAPIGAVLCSVVPSATDAWWIALHDTTGRRPFIVTHRMEIGLAIDYKRPHTLGADRLANVCAAAYQYTAPFLVADFGTAATFDMVTTDRKYIGGVIAPGPALMCDYLAERTAQLPSIRFKASRKRIGGNTRDAMRIGAYVGYIGLVRGIVKHLVDAPGMQKAALLATGGFAQVVARGTRLAFRVRPHLTLQGLSRIWLLNNK